MHTFFPLIKAVVEIRLSWITDNWVHWLPSSIRKRWLASYFLLPPSYLPHVARQQDLLDLLNCFESGFLSFPPLPSVSPGHVELLPGSLKHPSSPTLLHSWVSSPHYLQINKTDDGCQCWLFPFFFFFLFWIFKATLHFTSPDLISLVCNWKKPSLI